MEGFPRHLKRRKPKIAPSRKRAVIAKELSRSLVNASILKDRKVKALKRNNVELAVALESVKGVLKEREKEIVEMRKRLTWDQPRANRIKVKVKEILELLSSVVKRLTEVESLSSGVDDGITLTSSALDGSLSISPETSGNHSSQVAPSEIPKDQIKELPGQHSSAGVSANGNNDKPYGLSIIAEQTFEESVRYSGGLVKNISGHNGSNARLQSFDLKAAAAVEDVDKSDVLAASVPLGNEGELKLPVALVAIQQDSHNQVTVAEVNAQEDPFRRSGSITLRRSKRTKSTDSATCLSESVESASPLQQTNNTTEKRQRSFSAGQPEVFHVEKTGRRSSRNRGPPPLKKPSINSDAVGITSKAPEEVVLLPASASSCEVPESVSTGTGEFGLASNLELLPVTDPLPNANDLPIQPGSEEADCSSVLTVAEHPANSSESKVGQQKHRLSKCVTFKQLEGNDHTNVAVTRKSLAVRRKTYVVTKAPGKDLNFEDVSEMSTTQEKGGLEKPRVLRRETYAVVKTGAAEMHNNLDGTSSSVNTQNAEEKRERSPVAVLNATCIEDVSDRRNEPLAGMTSGTHKPSISNENVERNKITSFANKNSCNTSVCHQIPVLKRTAVDKHGYMKSTQMVEKEPPLPPIAVMLRSPPPPKEHLKNVNSLANVIGAPAMLCEEPQMNPVVVDEDVTCRIPTDMDITMVTLPDQTDAASCNSTVLNPSSRLATSANVMEETESKNFSSDSNNAEKKRSGNLKNNALCTHLITAALPDQLNQLEQSHVNAVGNATGQKELQDVLHPVEAVDGNEKEGSNKEKTKDKRARERSNKSKNNDKASVAVKLASGEDKDDQRDCQKYQKSCNPHDLMCADSRKVVDSASKEEKIYETKQQGKSIKTIGKVCKMLQSMDSSASDTDSDYVPPGERRHSKSKNLHGASKVIQGKKNKTSKSMEKVEQKQRDKENLDPYDVWNQEEKEHVDSYQSWRKKNRKASGSKRHKATELKQEKQNEATRTDLPEDSSDKLPGTKVDAQVLPVKVPDSESDTDSGRRIQPRRGQRLCFKEPPLNRKLRQGDPFTTSLVPLDYKTTSSSQSDPKLGEQQDASKAGSISGDDNKV